MTKTATSVSADLQRKIDQLEKYDNAYHNGKALISDAAYDLFKDSVIRQLPPGHPLLSKVGHAPSSQWPKERHTIFMGSQNKAVTEDEIRAWVKGALALVNEKSAEFVLQHKLDGFSLEMKYSSVLTAAVTRGNGAVGENITPNARMFRDVPGILPIANPLAVRGEGIIPTAVYEDLQKKVGDKYENPRNAASGISRRLNGSYSTYIHVIAYDITGKASKETDKIEALKKLGFETVPTFVCHDVDEILKLYRKFKADRDTLPYDIDGLVLKFNSVELQERAGVDKNKPLGQVALKFESDQALTKVKAIPLQVGRTGKVTPIGEFEPVRLMGTTVSRASLHNFDYIKQLGIGIGAEVTIEKRGDIIPQIVEVVNPGKDLEKPTKCPSCGGNLYDDGVNLWCLSDKCREKDVARITYWLEMINVKGFSDRFVDALYAAGKISSVSDLYGLTEKDFAGSQGIGQKTVLQFLKTLKDTAEMTLPKFIAALGIPGCAKSTADLLSDRFGSWGYILSATKDELTSIPGIGEVSATTILDGIKEIAPIAENILKAVRIKAKADGPLSGKSFCVTGSLAAMDRKEFYDFVAERGGTGKTSVSAGLGYLVTNDPSSGSSKNEKARKLGVKVISEDEFFKMAGGIPQAPAPSDPVAVPDKSMKLITESIFEE
jgi:DNA ligase (NAD+)